MQYAVFLSGRTASREGSRTALSGAGLRGLAASPIPRKLTTLAPLLSQDQSSLISFTPMHSLGEEGELIETIQQLSMARSVAQIQAIVRHTSRRLTGADGATFVLRDGDMCHYADEDAIAPLWKGQRFPMSACISGWVMLHREHAMIADIYADDRIPADAYRPTFVKSLLMVPIRQLDRSARSATTGPSITSRLSAR